MLPNVDKLDGSSYQIFQLQDGIENPYLQARQVRVHRAEPAWLTRCLRTSPVAGCAFTRTASPGLAGFDNIFAMQNVVRRGFQCEIVNHLVKQHTRLVRSISYAESRCKSKLQTKRHRVGND